MGWRSWGFVGLARYSHDQHVLRGFGFEAVNPLADQQSFFASAVAPLIDTERLGLGSDRVLAWNGTEPSSQIASFRKEAPSPIAATIAAATMDRCLVSVYPCTQHQKQRSSLVQG